MKAHRSLMAAVILMSGACSEGSGSGSEHFDEDAAFRERQSAMVDSDEWTAVHARYEECMIDLGYSGVNPREGITLKDGSVYKAEVGTGREQSGAYLDWRIDEERCQIDSGMQRVRAQFNVVDPTPNTNLVRAMNKYGTQQMACLVTKGWDIPEPRTLQGALVWDIRLETEEKRVAYYGDQFDCNMELFGTPGFPH